MSTPEENNQVKSGPPDFYLPDELHIQKLRKIINKETGFKFTYKETEEVSYQLIMLYEELARGRPIRPGKAAHGSG